MEANAAKAMHGLNLPSIIYAIRIICFRKKVVNAIE